jgi:hypothetical protein
VNSFPIGVGLALACLAAMESVAGWQAALLVAATVPAAALLLVALAYTPHANDGGKTAQARASFRLPAHELTLVCIAGAMWGLLNGGFGVMTGFAPLHLRAHGLAPAIAASWVAVATWAVVVSVQAGGIAALRWNRPALLIAIGCVGWALCMLTAAFVPALSGPALLGAGLLLGLPVGVILALPGQVLPAERRAAGMGVFYLWLYIGHGALPPLAGLLQDSVGGTAASLAFASVLALAIAGFYLWFRGQHAARQRAPGVAKVS